MARIKPLTGTELSPPIQKAFDDHVEKYQSRITNMKATLGHSLPAFEIYMQWYALYAEVKKILGERLAYLFAWSISHASNCPLCSTYFRKIIIDKGESPEKLELTDHEKEVLDFGSAIATQQGNIDNDVYSKLAKRFNNKEMVVIIAFAGQMIATNIFNNVIETEIDEYLFDYLPKSL
jgi:hypothetical protein